MRLVPDAHMIVYGATIPPFKPVKEQIAWLTHADAIRANTPDVSIFCALETDGRGIEPFTELLQHLKDADATYWVFSIDDQETEYTSARRLHRICAGRNLIIEYALRHAASWVMFVDSDVEIPGDAIPKLLELEYPIVGGEVREYCLSGPAVPGYSFQVEEHWNTAGFLLVDTGILAKVRWRHDVYTDGLTDDPAFAQDVEARFGFKTRVRKDVIGRHAPLIPLEARSMDRRIR